MLFQPDGYECAFLYIPMGLVFMIACVMTLVIPTSIWKKEISPWMLLIVPACWGLLYPFFLWQNASVEGVKQTARVDELYYFDIQHIKTADGKVEEMFLDNRGRLLKADTFGTVDDTKIVRKRVFRGKSHLLSWEWMEFDIIPKSDKREEIKKP